MFSQWTKTRSAFVLLSVAAFVAAAAGNAVPARASSASSPAPLSAGLVYPHGAILRQPDGAAFSADPWGDGTSHGYDVDGYTIVQNAQSYWVFASGVDGDGQLVASDRRADRDAPPASAQPQLRPKPQAPPQAAPAFGAPAPSPVLPHTGTEPTIVILGDYGNQVGQTTPASWASRFFGASGSVSSFWKNASYNNLTLAPVQETSGTANDGVVGWVRLGTTHPNPAAFDTSADNDAVQTAAKDAVNKANAFVDYATYDTNHDGVVDNHELHVVVILAGYETSYGGNEVCGNSVWGHRWSIFKDGPPAVDNVAVGGKGYAMFGEMHCANWDSPGHQATIGIMAHEVGHDLELPDLYDTDFSSEGVGEWSIMGGGGWLGSPAGSTPGNAGAFEKYYEGWVTPQDVTAGAAGVSVATASTTADVKRIRDNPNGVDWSMDNHIGTGEYFLVENRQKTGNDAAIPGCGLLVWHINEARSSNEEDTNRLVDVVEADGLNQLDSNGPRGDAGDPYPGSSNNANLGPSTNPNSNLNDGSASGVTVRVNSTSCAATMSMDVNQAPATTFSVDDTQVSEGNTGSTTNMSFAVRLSAAQPVTTYVFASTTDGTATAPGDYTAVSGFKVKFPAGATTKTVNVVVNGDATNESSETLTLNLSGASGATIADAQATGTIVNDDGGGPTVPGAPTMKSAIAQDQAATIAFAPPASNGGAAITSYTVTASPGGKTVTGASSPLKVTGLTNGTTYKFTVHATNSVGNGAESLASKGVVPQPLSVKVLTPNGGESLPRGTTYNITWSCVSCLGTTAKVEVLKNGSVVSTPAASKANNGKGTGGAAKWTPPPSLAAGSGYTVRVTINGTAVSDVSDAAFSLT